MAQHAESIETSNEPILRFSMTIGADHTAVGLLGSCVNRIVSSYLDETESSGYELCVVEALNNVIEHGAAGSGELSIDVELEIFDNRICARIRDAGSKIPNMAFRNALAFDFDPSDTEKLPEGGMGLFLITSFMHDVTYEWDEDNRNCLYMARDRTG